MKAQLLLLALLPLAAAQYNVQAAVSFANANWNCATASCSSRVSAGTFQSSYQCAEFVSRSIAAGGAIPGLSSTAAQSTYGSFGYKGRTYNLMWTSSYWGGVGLEDLVKTLGWKSIGTDCTKVGAGHVVFTGGNGGPFSHVVIGVGNRLVNSHNAARYQVTSCWYGQQVSAIYQAPGTTNTPAPPPANCKGRYAVNANGVNLRAAGTPTGTILSVLNSGDIVYDIVGTTSANGGYNWRKVVSGSTVGFINDNLITVSGVCSAGVAQKYCATAEPALNIRDKPCTDGNRIGAIPKDNFVIDLGIAETACDFTWRKVNYEGVEGYAADQYLTPCTPIGQYVNANATIDTTSNCSYPNFPPANELLSLPSAAETETSTASLASVVTLFAYLAIVLLA